MANLILVICAILCLGSIPACCGVPAGGALCDSSVSFIVRDSVAIREFGAVNGRVQLRVVDTLSYELVAGRINVLAQLFPNLNAKASIIALSDSIVRVMKSERYCEAWSGYGVSRFSTTLADSSYVSLSVIDAVTYPGYFIQVADVYRVTRNDSEDRLYGGLPVLSYVFVYDSHGKRVRVIRTISPVAAPKFASVSRYDFQLFLKCINYIKKDSALSHLADAWDGALAFEVSGVVACPIAGNAWEAEDVLSSIYPQCERGCEGIVDSLWLIHLRRDTCMPQYDKQLARMSQENPNCSIALYQIDRITAPGEKIVYAETALKSHLPNRISYVFVFNSEDRLIKALSAPIEIER